MLDRPDPASLLQALAGFLAQEVRPQVSDRGLSFRLLIASNLLQTLALQSEHLPRAESEAAQRLAQLLPEIELPGAAPAPERLARLELALVERLRGGSWDEVATPELLAHLRRALRAELQIANPRFDADAEVP